MPATFPWLTVVVFLPLAGAVLLFPATLLARRSRDAVWRWGAVVVSVAAFVASLGMVADFETGRQGFQLVERATWVSFLNFRYTVCIDGISLFLVLLTTFLTPLAILASWKIERQVPAYMASMLVLETAMLGAFVALDLLLFFVFFRAGSVLGEPTFELETLVGLPLPAVTARWLFLAFFLAFAVKVPLFPLHTWLPDAHVEAPTAGSVLLAGVLLKVGAYGLI